VSSEREPNSVILYDRAGAGDHAAIEELLVLHIPDLRAFVRLRIDPALRQREAEEDLVQSTCREVLLRASRVAIRSEESFRNWLYGAVLNKVRDRHRYHFAERRSPAHEESTPIGSLAQSYSRLSPSQAAVSREGIEKIEAAFDELPDEYREVISLSRFARLPSAEIAILMGRSDNAVRQLLRRALARLGTLLAREN
jgi:RNA polymerase sigma-70 factor, ECF subfamily